MSHAGDAKDKRAGRATPPSPSYMSNDQFASYLSELRNNRVARPSGARPLPGRGVSSTSTAKNSGRASPATLTRQQTAQTTGTNNAPSHERKNSDGSHFSSFPSRVTGSLASRHTASTATTAQPGRDYFPDRPTPPLDLSVVVPSATYIERGQRWMEKEEAVSLRRALDDMTPDRSGPASPRAQDDESRIHEAALDEAAELVWQHQHSYKPPAPGTPYKYKPHMRKDSYAQARTASVNAHSGEVAATGLGRDIPRSVSGSSSGSEGLRRKSAEHPDADDTGHAEQPGNRRRDPVAQPFFRPQLPGSRVAPVKGSRRSSMKRNISGQVEPPFSGDQIWEEPDAQQAKKNPSRSDKPQDKESSRDSKKFQEPVPHTGQNKTLPRKDPESQVSAVKPSVVGSRRTLPWLTHKRPSNTEIHLNPPSQSRNPQYTSNTSVDKPLKNDDKSKKHGMEVRGDDIVNATSMKLKDRSPRLPTPSAVSDSPGRPIVSFDANWKAPEEEADVKIDPPRKGPRPQAKQDEVGTPPVAKVGRKTPEAMGENPSSSQLPSIQLGKSGPPIPCPPCSTAPTLGIPPTKTNTPPPVRSAVAPPPPHSDTRDTRYSGAQRTHTTHPLPNIMVDPARPSAPQLKRDMAPIPSIATQEERPIPSISIQEDRPIPSIVIQEDTPSRPLPDITVTSSPAAGGPSTSGYRGRDPKKSPLPSMPTIVAPDDGPQPSPSRRPLPVPNQQSSKGSQRPRGHWSPAAPQHTRATAKCHECMLPIEGRFVALGGVGERFHPQCFRCYCCGTRLEALEISPEPDERRAERISRIKRREAGEILPEEEGKTAAQDGDQRLRFFCHLDWHELYAPRCKHCTTPILGEHIVALGEHWHYGHFFCAECGDPFEQGMTHIEKDGYAWCVGCQTKRTERRAPKCKRCKKATIGQYIRALGGEWHDECFRCATCHGGFDDGQVFPIERGNQSVIVCTKCRQIELKA